jgi:hypothetical protein
MMQAGWRDTDLGLVHGGQQHVGSRRLGKPWHHEGHKHRVSKTCVSIIDGEVPSVVSVPGPEWMGGWYPPVRHGVA